MDTILTLTTAPFKNAILRDQPFSEYTEIPAMSATVMKAAFKGRSISMLNLRHAFDHGREDSESMLFGRALHCLMFEPATFGTRYCAYDGVRNARHKAYQEFLDDHRGYEILKAFGQFSMEDALEAGKAFINSESVLPLIEAGEGELTLLAEVSGVQCRCRLDWVSESAKCLTDMKTTRDVSERAFGRQFFQLRYDLQLGFYHHMFRLMFGYDWPVKCLAVESRPPYEVVVYDIPRSVLEKGFDDATAILTRLKRCIAKNDWPGIAPIGSVPLYVPEWEMLDDQVEWDESLVEDIP